MLYDKKIKAILGEDVVKEILHSVRKGDIDKTKLGEIAQAYVFGNHQRRIESGNKADRAEFRNILREAVKKNPDILRSG